MDLQRRSICRMTLCLGSNLLKSSHLFHQIIGLLNEPNILVKLQIHKMIFAITCCNRKVFCGIQASLNGVF